MPSQYYYISEIFVFYIFILFSLFLSVNWKEKGKRENRHVRPFSHIRPCLWSFQFELYPRTIVLRHRNVEHKKSSNTSQIESNWPGSRRKKEKCLYIIYTRTHTQHFYEWTAADVLHCIWMNGRATLENFQ